MNPRVMVTGMGVVSSAGNKIDDFARRIASGTPAFFPIHDPRIAHCKAAFAGLIEHAPVIPQLSRYDRYVHLAVAAAGSALSMAGVDPREHGDRFGLIFATCSGPMVTVENHFKRLVSGEGDSDPEDLFAQRYYSAAKVVAHIFGIRGFSTTVVTACSASLGALGIAVDMIRCGMLDYALVGGADAFAASTLLGFDGLKATHERLCAPFSKPAGLNLGEGAGFMILESESAAALRSACCHAEILGYGLSNDAYHCSAPDPTGRGQARAIIRALDDAGLSAASLSYVNAHGTGTDANDKAETRAIRRALGDRAESIPVSSTKSMVGHCLGAAGMIESIAAISCARAGVLPPTAGFTEPREGCTLDYVPDPGRSWTGSKVFLKNNFAFGGNNASVVIDAGMTAARPAAKLPEEQIVLTALGTCSPSGVGAESMAVAAVPATAPYGRAPGITCATIPPVDGRAIDRRLDFRGMDRPSVFATVAAWESLKNAGISERSADTRAEIGFILHVSGAPSHIESTYLTALFRSEFHLDQLTEFPYLVPNAVHGNACRALSLTGHNTTICNGPGGGLVSIAAGIAALQNRRAAAVLAGSVDELTERTIVDEFSAGLLKAGDVPRGEGASVAVLETATHARSRGAHAYALIRSVTCSMEIERIHSADSGIDALSDCIARAISMAGITPDEIRAVCCNSRNKRLADALKLTGVAGAEIVDISSRIGYAPGTHELFCMAHALQSPEIRPGPILAVAASAHGMDCALIIEKAKTGAMG
jgi:3-oxoacyl-[acyl-carrier-protein] synthase II